MKKCMLIILTLLCSCIYADCWQENWVKAVQNCEGKNYLEAEIYFGKTIDLISSEKNTENYHVYVDRARLFLLLDRCEEALVDVSIGISQGRLSNFDMERALVTRIVIFGRLNVNHEQKMKDIEALKKFDLTKPQEEVTNEHIILRNIPSCPCYRQIMTSYFVNSGICEKESDIQILHSNVMIVKRKQCKKGIDCDCLKKKETKGTEDGCRWYCDKATTAGYTFCGTRFKSTRCSAACCWAVEYIRDGCYWCCQGGDYYDRCIKPFEFILDFIKEPCDPYWD